MEAANEAGTDRAFGVKSLEEETILATSTESSAGFKPSHINCKSYGHTSNVLADLPRVNKGGAIRGEGTQIECGTTFIYGWTFLYLKHVVLYCYSNFL